MTLLKPALLTAASSARLERGRRGHPAGRLASGVARKLKARDVTDPLADPLADLFRPRGARGPGHIRSNRGPAVVARAIPAVDRRRGRQDGPSRPGPPLGDRMRRKLQRPAPGRPLDGRPLLQLAKGQDRDRTLAIERWHQPTNPVRPHAPPSHRPPAPEELIPALAAGPAAPLRPAPPARLPMAPPSAPNPHHPPPHRRRSEGSSETPRCTLIWRVEPTRT